MKVANQLKAASRRLQRMMNEPMKRPIDLTLEEKETEARLNGCALMYQGGNVYALCVDAFRQGQPCGNKWRLIHRANSFQ